MEIRDIIADRLKDAGFGARIYRNAVFAYLRNRDIGTMEVAQALGGISDLVWMRQAADPYCWNRKGVTVRI